MTPRKILIVVVFIAALLAILIAVSGPHGDAGIESSATTVHSSDIIEGKAEPADYTEGVVYQDQEEEAEVITEESFMEMSMSRDSSARRTRSTDLEAQA